MEAIRDIKRVQNITHYIIARTLQNELGATKLNKVLWLADLFSWREQSKSLTGIENYQRMPHGPVPPAIEQILGGLKSSNKVVEIPKPTPVGDRREFASLVEPELNGFSASDIDIINRAIDFITPRSANVISEMTHDYYWEEIGNGEPMNVGAAALWFKQIDQDAISWATRELSGEPA